MKNNSNLVRLISAALIAVAAIASAPAVAAAAEGHDWTGAYVGGNVGAGMSSGKIDDPDCYNCADQAFNERLLQLGINGGYNKQFGVAVVGLEAEVNWGSQNHRNQIEGEPDVSRLDWTGAVLGRAGLAAKDTLFFVEAGPAIAHTSGDLNNGTNGGWAYNVWQPGFKTAVGLEFMVSSNVSVRAQYSMLTVADRTVYGYFGNARGDRQIWANSQSVATVGAAWHF